MDCFEWRREIVLQTSLSDFVWQRNVNYCMHGHIIIMNRVERNGHTYAHTVGMDELIVPICTYVRTYVRTLFMHHTLLIWLLEFVEHAVCMHAPLDPHTHTHTPITHTHA